MSAKPESELHRIENRSFICYFLSLHLYRLHLFDSFLDIALHCDRLTIEGEKPFHEQKQDDYGLYIGT